MLRVDIFSSLTIELGVFWSAASRKIVVFLIVGLKRSFVFIVEGKSKSSNSECSNHII